MSIIVTKYRDIPWATIRPNLILSRTKLRKVVWERMRGTRVRIETPPHKSNILGARCKCGQHGLAFNIIRKNGQPKINKLTGRTHVVCPHIAEIGD